MKIEKGRRVKLKAKLKVKGGDVLEQSVVEYFQGGGTMLPGLERILEGLEKGAMKSGVIPAKDAFGDSSLHPVKTMTRAEFPEDAKLEVGQEFIAKGEKDGLNVVLKIEKIEGGAIDVRLVHPLAKKDIEYDVEVLSVTDPKPPPLPAAAIAAAEEIEADPEADEAQ